MEAKLCNEEIKETLEDQIASMLELVMADDSEDNLENDFLFASESLETSSITSFRKKDKAHTIQNTNIKQYMQPIKNEDQYIKMSKQNLPIKERTLVKKFHTSNLTQTLNYQICYNKDPSFIQNIGQFTNFEDSSEFSPKFCNKSNQTFYNISNTSSGLYNQSTNNSIVFDNSTSGQNFYNLRQFHYKNMVQRADLSYLNMPENSNRSVNCNNIGNTNNLTNWQNQIFPREKAFGTNFPNNQVLTKDMMVNEIEAFLRKTDKIDEFLFSKLKGNFISIIQTQNGSRLFQSHLKNTSPGIIRKIFRELKGNLLNMMTDPYANYFCQKIYGFLSKEDQHNFISEVSIV